MSTYTITIVGCERTLQTKYAAGPVNYSECDELVEVELTTQSITF